MTLSAFRDPSQFLANARSLGWLDEIEFSYIDVGVSGGIPGFWRQFEPNLRAIGFDPLITEIDRLKSAEKNPKICYEAAFVGSNGEKPEQNGNSMFSLTSAARAAKAANFDYIKEEFNRGAELGWSDRSIVLDEWIKTQNMPSPDVLKSDVDGFDFDVLSGAAKMLAEGTTLAVISECQFHEPIGARRPVFAEIDRFMRDCGYRLFDMNIYHYTRAELPGTFQHEIFAQTETGQIQFCDALYMLDPMADAQSLERILNSGEPSKLTKLMLLYGAFGLPDCAAALISKMKTLGISAGPIDLAQALGRLVHQAGSGHQSYPEYIQAFDANPRAWFPIRHDLTIARQAAELRRRSRLLNLEYSIRRTLSKIGGCLRPSSGWPLQ